ncbi:MAG: hypothetical protein ABSG86_10985 [Thermoguttaceae bacterium]|jgi:hypothetical protein
MGTEVGEYVVGAYLQHIKKCDFVTYNARSPGGTLAGLPEMDVVAIKLNEKEAYMCEATTHIRGLLYKNNEATIRKIKKKFEAQKKYARSQLKGFAVTYMFWSPVVPVGYLTTHLHEIRGLELVINGEYKKRVEELRAVAKRETCDLCNPFLRAMQIIEHMRE